MIDNTFWINKKVFITGHTGFKGTWLALWLWRLGAKVYGYALAPNTTPALFNILDMSEKVTHFLGDIRDFSVLKKALQQAKPDIIIHMAAQPLVRYSYEHPIETYSTNVMGTVHLLEAMREIPTVRVVLNVTTDKCYENNEWHWGYRENEPLGGHDPYSNSKACSELVTAAYRNSYFPPSMVETHGKAIATARAGNVIGGGDWALDRLIPDIMASFLDGKAVEIRNPQAIRPWQHVLEPLSGYLVLIQKMWECPGEFASGWNFGPFTDDVKPVLDIVQYIAKKWDGARWDIIKNTDFHEAEFLKLDIAKAMTKLSWKPRWALEETLDAIVEWYKDFASGKADMLRLTLSQIENYEKNKERLC
ncbi:MAG: CDP-glucose 4,6-dehydratase [Legionellaceae bacterium]|nr:CDP-glucose 4,6-dehydratase [Legionellaceae bacterium]